MDGWMDDVTRGVLVSRLLGFGMDIFLACCDLEFIFLMISLNGFEILNDMAMFPWKSNSIAVLCKDERNNQSISNNPIITAMNRHHRRLSLNSGAQIRQ